MEILNVKNLSFTYPKCKVPIIKDVSFSVREGEFVVLCGATGSGKSTLLKALKPEITPLGEKRGCISLLGKEFQLSDEEDKNRFLSSKIGYVCQNPKEQAVTDKVWHELAFGLENQNTPVEEMRIRVAEMSSYFGIDEWFDKKVNELSGGQLQLLNLASVMVMDPEILILDEPSAQLDPVAASAFFNTLKKLNEDFSLTIIIAEHRLEELIPICDRIMVLRDAGIAGYGTPFEVLPSIAKDDEIFEALPAAFRFYSYSVYDKICSEEGGKYPLNIRDGRDMLRTFLNDNMYKTSSDIKKSNHTDGKAQNRADTLPALEFKNVSFRYYRDAADSLKDISFKVNSGEIFCMLGGNGSGKTTALGVAAGLLKPYEGYIKVQGKKLKEYKNQSLYNKCLSMLPQDVQTLFLHNTVREELDSRHYLENLQDYPFDLSDILDKHPYDISGGEQQLAALALVLATEPRIILLDEPTKGLDAYKKKKLAMILKSLKQSGITIWMVTHDVEFAALCADRCALLFRGSITSCGETEDFLRKNYFYTTSVCRMSRGIFEGPVTVEGLIRIFKETV